jgi:hypothetical protein
LVLADAVCREALLAMPALIARAPEFDAGPLYDARKRLSAEVNRIKGGRLVGLAAGPPDSPGKGATHVGGREDP